jgi:hypothetical protein
LARKDSLLSRIVLTTTILVLAENMQIAEARAGQLDQLLEKLHWQLNLIAGDEGRSLRHRLFQGGKQ